MSGSPYKRPRFLSPHGAPTPGDSPAPPGMDIVPHVPDKKHDLLDFFADRNERARSQDEKIRGLQSACEALEGQLKRAKATIDSQKVFHKPLMTFQHEQRKDVLLLEPVSGQRGAG